MDQIPENLDADGTEAAAAAPPITKKSGWRNWPLRRWGLIILAIFVVACLMRETGLYDFSVSRDTTDSKANFRTSRLFPRPPLRVVRWTEVREGIQIDFENGSKGLLMIDRLTYSGLTWFPLYKRFSCRAQASLRSDDGLLTGTSEGTIVVTIWGLSSSRRSRNYARVGVLNQICQTLASQPQ